MESEAIIFDDEGLSLTLHQHPEALEQPHEPAEEPAAMAVEPLDLTERAVITYNHHKKLFKGLGGAMLGGLGFTVGALAFSRPR